MRNSTLYDDAGRGRARRWQHHAVTGSSVWVMPRRMTPAPRHHTWLLARLSPLEPCAPSFPLQMLKRSNEPVAHSLSACVSVSPKHMWPSTPVHSPRQLPLKLDNFSPDRSAGRVIAADTGRPRAAASARRAAEAGEGDGALWHSTKSLPQQGSIPCSHGSFPLHVSEHDMSPRPPAAPASRTSEPRTGCSGMAADGEVDSTSSPPVAASNAACICS
mmetsp:Transcript_7918/g.23864  ORF Transcript_7918/g.23864 Transcript_7918/m.23864 type:complete len:217 (+) Transcript_7918:2992-3642(+)